MGYWAWKDSQKPVCDRQRVASCMLGSFQAYAQDEPEGNQLILDLGGDDGFIIIKEWYNLMTVKYAYGNSFGNWLKKSAKMSYDSGLFGISEKGMMQMSYDIKKIVGEIKWD